jgi:hypothetical protein
MRIGYGNMPYAGPRHLCPGRSVCAGIYEFAMDRECSSQNSVSDPGPIF